MNTTALTANQILAIPLLEAERLFGAPEVIQDRYHALAKRWHPDRPDGDATVFAHIGSLLERAKHLAEIGMWHVPGVFEFTSAGKQYRVRYLRSFDFELGKLLFGHTLLTYVIANEFGTAAANARKMISEIRYPDDKTKDVMSRYLPKLVAYHETTTDVVITIEKPTDLIRLRDLATHLGGSLDPKHVAWIVSRMLNLASFFEWAKLSHNDISLDTLFIAPEHHSIHLLGGWWYATPIGNSLKGCLLPSRTVAHGSEELIRKKLATARTDPELIRLTARELLGDSSGIRLLTDVAMPRSMIDWLRMSGSGSALEDYTQWRERILPASFGPRRFVKMNVTAHDVYPDIAEN